MNYTVYDIETGPLPTEQVLAALPPFDPSEVKVGNIKDPEKIAAKIEEAEATYKAEAIDRAALNPMTGKVLAIGYCYHGDSAPFISSSDGQENLIIEHFWNYCREELHHNRRLVGFNSHLFDLPFLVRRSWHLRVAVPRCVRKGRYWADDFVDLRDTWQLGDRMAHGSLDSISRFLGIGQKNGDGKNFAALWESDRQKALEYLKNDLELTAKLAAVLLGE